MKKVVFISSLLVSVIGITSFFMLSRKPGFIKAKELHNYINNPENGLVKENTSGDVQVKLIYKPSDFLVAQETMGGKKDHQKYERMYGENYYFMLSISKGGQELESFFYNSTPAFNKKIGELSGGMKRYITLRTDKDSKIDLSDYIYSRMYGMSGNTAFMLIQEKKSIQDSKWVDIIIKDFGIGMSDQYFRFYLRDIEQTPKLEF